MPLLSPNQQHQSTEGWQCSWWGNTVSQMPPPCCYNNNNNNNNNNCSTATEQGAAAKQAADNKTAKYQELEKTHIFFPVAIETAGAWSQQSHRTGARNRETHHWDHRGQQRNCLPLSEAVRCFAKGKCGLILRHFPARLVSRCKKK